MEFVRKIRATDIKLEAISIWMVAIVPGKITKDRVKRDKRETKNTLWARGKERNQQRRVRRSHQ